MISDSPLLLTDLDGTVLNRFTYQWEGNEARIRTLIHSGIPVIFSSSKTAAEQQALCEDLAVPVPFFSENGSAFHVPLNWTVQFPAGAEFMWQEIPLVPAGFSIQKVRDQLVGRLPGSIRLMTTLSDEELARLTGLTVGMASKARKKTYTDTLMLATGQGVSFMPADWLQSMNVQAEPGTRYVTIRHAGAGKDHAVSYLRTWLKETHRVSLYLVAAGDGDNDLGMLATADEGWWLGGEPVPAGLHPARQGPAGFLTVTERLLKVKGIH